MLPPGKKFKRMNAAIVERNGNMQLHSAFWSDSREDPLVSMIVPVFNVEKYLPEAMNSILQQSYGNLEILLIDDGSTDRSGDICDEYGKMDRRITVIHQENHGLSAARNVGLDRMRGELMAFLDPDDACHPDYIREMVSVMQRENADIVICRYAVCSTTSAFPTARPKRTEPKLLPGHYDRPAALRALAEGTLNCSVWNKLFRRKLWDSVRFPEGHVYEDLDTAFQVFDLCSDIYMMERVLYLYRSARPGSITSGNDWNSYDDWLLAQSHFAAFIRTKTPEIFTARHLQIRQQSVLRSLLRRFCIRQTKTPGNDRSLSDESLQQRITEAAVECSIKDCSLSTRAAYWMYRLHSPLLKALYPLYHGLKAVLRTLFR